MNVAIRIGIIFIICLVSSTWVTGHRFHGVLGPLFTAALSRSLQEVREIGDETSRKIALCYTYFSFLAMKFLAKVSCVALSLLQVCIVFF